MTDLATMLRATGAFPGGDLHISVSVPADDAGGLAVPAFLAELGDACHVLEPRQVLIYDFHSHVRSVLRFSGPRQYGFIARLRLDFSPDDGQGHEAEAAREDGAGWLARYPGSGAGPVDIVTFA